MFFVIEVCWSLKILVVRLVCKRLWGAIKRVCGFCKYECMRIPVSLVFIKTSSGDVEHFESEQGTRRGIFALQALQETHVQLSNFKLAPSANVAR